MINILIVATSPQRFIDQLHLANEINSKSYGNIKINFFLDEKVYRRYKQDINNFDFHIINDVSMFTDTNEATNRFKFKDFIVSKS